MRTSILAMVRCVCSSRVHVGVVGVAWSRVARRFLAGVISRSFKGMK